MQTYTALFPFGGIGAGALGFQRARNFNARFQILGGIDFDPAASKVFLDLLGAPSLCADISKITPEQLRGYWPCPDVVFFSPPCKGSSSLLGSKLAETPKYQEMNQLALKWTRLMLRAWTGRPHLLLLENVPRMKQRAGDMLRELVEILQAEGYAVHEGFHDCGEIGGLGQHRRRYLLVARRKATVKEYLYHPLKQRVKSCGEVLEALPLPEDPAAGPLHRLPRISWLNWVRLALIPAGGDWKDLPPEVQLPDTNPNRFNNVFQVIGWGTPSPTITGASRPGSGSVSVADPRLDYLTRDGTNRVTPWGSPSPTVTGSSGRPGHCSGGIVADPRLGCTPHDGVYGVLPWNKSSGTVTGSARLDTGRFSVADPRLPEGVPLILSGDGTWHRPLTTLELAVLQGLPTTLRIEGTIAKARELIGNAVPVGAAQAIAEEMLVTLEANRTGLSIEGCGERWVRAPEMLQPQT